MHAKILILWALSVVMGTPLVAASPEADWKQFREKFPYHIQTIAIGAPNPDGTRTVILSEPPPSVTLEDLSSRYGDRIAGLTSFRQVVGYDGWVTDVVGTIASTNDEALNALSADLSRDLFGTAYKSHMLAIGETQHAAGVDTALDLTVSAYELRTWLGLTIAPSGGSWLAPWAWLGALIALLVFLRSRKTIALTLALSLGLGAWWIGRTSTSSVTTFKALHASADEDDQTLDALMAGNRRGVFHSNDYGLVALIVPRSEPLNSSTIAIREFALDADLVLGAVGTPTSVAVFGRERQVPLATLPPLRTETILQLAAATTEELGQSYERKRLFAGKFDRVTHHDWAPIYLSDELWDTEYGSLLNITDQLLKSWSQKGQIEYVNFPYPKPGKYPFPEPLHEHAKSTNVTFNWNTKGVGYVDSDRGHDVMAFVHTGALPVDYLGGNSNNSENSNRLRDAEDAAYQYFVGRNDPNLARVVQYAGVYQIWRQFGVTASAMSSKRPRAGNRALSGMARELLWGLLRMNPAYLRTMFSDEEWKTAVTEFEPLQARLSNFVREHGGGAVDSLAAVIVDLRRQPQDWNPGWTSGLPTDAERELPELARALLTSEVVRTVSNSMVDEARLLFATFEGGADPDSWIKTPSIVESWSTGSDAANATGGHNLSSRISQFRVDRSLPEGKVSVIAENGEPVALYNPGRGVDVRSSTREFGRSESRSVQELENIVQKGITTQAKARPIPEGLRLGSNVAKGERGLNPAHVEHLVSRQTWSDGGAMPAANRATLDTLGEPSLTPIMIERQGTQYAVSIGGQPNVMRAGDSASVLDAVMTVGIRSARANSVHLHFKNVALNQARQFSRSVELHGTRSKDFRLRTSVEPAEGGTPKVVAELNRGTWRWSEARLTSNLDELVGKKVSSLDLEISVPRLSALSNLRATLRVHFRQSVVLTKQLLARVEAVVNNWLQSLASIKTRIDLNIATRQLMKDLRDIDPVLANVETHIATETGEITIIVDLTPGSHEHVGN